MGDNNLFTNILNNIDNNTEKPKKPDGTGSLNVEQDKSSREYVSEILPRHLDPRDDLGEDHEIWVSMLKLCFTYGEELENKGWLWEALHGLRCGGARIKRIKGEVGFRILPGNEDWRNKKEWGRVKNKYLDPIKDDLIELFKITKKLENGDYKSKLF